MLMLLDGEMAVATGARITEWQQLHRDKLPTVVLRQGHLDTCRAVQKFNELSQADINVAAALHLTC